MSCSLLETTRGRSQLLICSFLTRVWTQPVPVGPSTHSRLVFKDAFKNHRHQSPPRAQSGFKRNKEKLLKGRNFYRLWASDQSRFSPSSTPSPLSLNLPSFLSASTSFYSSASSFHHLPPLPPPSRALLSCAESLSSRLQKSGDSFTLYQTCMPE